MMNNNNYSPMKENVQEAPADSYFYEEPSSSSSIWSTCFPCFQSKEVEANSLLQESNRDSSSWMVQKLKDLKEYSEVVAGPKWKNFVRKIGKYCSNNPPKKAKMQFQYDSDSYALNFDNAADDDADDGLLRNFSTRFAAPFAASSVSTTNNNNPNRNNAGL